MTNVNYKFDGEPFSGYRRSDSAEDYEIIKITFWDAEDRPNIIRKLRGRWLVGDEAEGIRGEQDESGAQWDPGVEYSVAETEKGTLVAYARHSNDAWAPRMEVYDSFVGMKDAASREWYPALPANVVAQTAAALGEPFDYVSDEDLNI